MLKTPWILAGFCSLLLHFLILCFFIITPNTEEKLGGMDAKLDKFSSIMIVSTLDQDSLKELSQDSVKMKKNEEKTIKKESTPLIAKNSYKAKIQSSQVNDKTKKEEEKTNSFDSNLNAKLKEQSQSMPIKGHSQEVSSPILGSKAKEIKSYQGIVKSHLNRYKKYPLQALNNKNEGVATLKISIDEKGEVLQAQIQKTSGFEILDQESLELFKRASPLPKPPQNLLNENKKLNFNIPIDYNIAKFYSKSHS